MKSKDRPHLPTLNEEDIESLERLNFVGNGTIYCRACRSALPGYDGEDPVAKNFADRQQVTTWGERGFATFSESPDSKHFWDRVSKVSSKVYLNAYGTGEKKLNGYGSIMSKKKFVPDPD